MLSSAAGARTGCSQSPEHPIVRMALHGGLGDEMIAANNHLSDADSWLNRGRANHPLFWDRQRLPKPAFHAVVEVLLRAR